MSPLEIFVGTLTEEEKDKLRRELDESSRGGAKQTN